MAQPQRAFTVFVIAILGLIGAAVLIWATPLGINVTPDSVAYIGAARSLLAGNGLGMPTASGTWQPLTHYPPLYPLLLATLGLTGVDPLAGARWLNSCFFGANILLTGLILYRRFPGQRWAPIAGALLTFFSVTMLGIHAAAWTEPASLFFGFGGLFLLSEYIESHRRGLLVASSIAVGAAVLTRYAALPYLIAGGIGILLQSDRSRVSRWADALVFCTIGSLPVLVWLVQNLWIGASATNRSLDYHPIRLQHIKSALNTYSTWLLPAALPSIFRVGLSLAISASLLGAYVYFRRTRSGSYPGLSSHAQPFLRLLMLFSGVYGLFLLATVSFVDALLPLDQRILSPLYIAWVCFIIYILDYLAHVVSPSGIVRNVAAALLAALLLSSLFQSIGWALANRQNGGGYTTRAWQQSEVVQQIKQLPPNTPIFSNGEDAVYILTGRPASSVPHILDAISNQNNQDYATELAQMEARLRTRAGVVVYFNRFPERVWNVSEDELQTALPLHVLYAGADGTIYSIDMRR